MKTLPVFHTVLRFSRAALGATAGMALAAATLHAGGPGPIEKDAGNTALNDGTSWVGGVAPGPGNVAVFGSAMGTLSAGVTNAIPLGADFTVAGIHVGPGPTLGQANNANGIVVTNALANNITIGSSGIAVASDGVPFQLQGNIILSANQTWNVDDASAQITSPASGTGSALSPFGLSQQEDLAFLTTAAGQVLELGGNTLTKTGNGAVVFQAGHTVGNGTINVNAGTFVIQGGSTRAATINANTTINVANGAILRYQSNNNAPTNSFAPINLADGATLNLSSTNANAAVTVNGTITVAGTTTLSLTPSVGGSNTNTTYNLNANIFGSGTVNLFKTTTAANATFNLLGDNSGFNGTFNIAAPSGSRTIRLASATAGSAAAVWNIDTANTLQVHGVAVQLGALTGAGNISGSAAGAVANVGAGNFSGVLGANLSLNKVAPLSGPNFLLLGGNSPAYTGTTTISNGIIVLTGNIANSPVVIENLGGLGGNGTAGGVTTQPGGILAPDGVLTVGSLLWAGSNDASSTIGFELSNTGSTSDQLTISGAFTKGSGSFFSFEFSNTGNALGGPTVYTLITFASTNFSPGDFSYTGLASGLVGTFGVTANALTLSVSAVPEPAEWAALFGAVALLAAVRRRRA